MGFLTPDVPKPLPPPNPAITPVDKPLNPAMGGGSSSLITAGPAGLRRKSDLNKTSLIGGG